MSKGSIVIGGVQKFSTELSLGKAVSVLNDFIDGAADSNERARYYLDRGFVKQQYGVLAEAFDDYHQASELTPFDPLPACMKGMISREQGRPELAIAYFTLAIKKAEEVGEVYGSRAYAFYVERGLTYKQLGKPHLAIQDFSDAFVLSGGDKYADRLHEEMYQKIISLSPAADASATPVPTVKGGNVVMTPIGGSPGKEVRQIG